MASVAVDQDNVLGVSVEAAERRHTIEPRAPAQAEGSWLERRLLRHLPRGGQDPGSLVRRVRRNAAVIACRLGLGRLDGDLLLTTTAHDTCLPRRATIGPVLVDDRLYVLNLAGERACWYRNLMADPIVTMQRRGQTWTARAIRVTDPDEAAALHQASRDAGIRWWLHVHMAADTAEAFAEHIDDLHLLRFDPLDEPGPAPVQADLRWLWPGAGALGLLGGLARRSASAAIVWAIVAFVILVVAAFGWQVTYARIEARGTHPEGRWARLFAWAGPRLTWWLYDAFDEVLELGPDDDVLDVACGCGAFLRTHATQAHSVAGVDHSVTLIDIARRENQERIDAGTAEFKVADVTELPWDDGTFSVVTSNDVGCYEPKAEAAIGEMYRVLRSGGRAVIADDRLELMVAAGFTEVQVEPILRFGRITRGIKP